MSVEVQSRPTLKRKVDAAFFAPKTKSSYTAAVITAPATVPGLEIIHDFITPAEEVELLAFLNGPTCQWRTDLARRVMHFGGTYCCLPPPAERKTTKPETKQAPPMPSELDWLMERLTTSQVLTEDQKAEYCIVNEYVKAQGISPHTENFSFQEPVMGLSLGSEDSMRFHQMKTAYDGSVRSGKAGQAPYTGVKIDVKLPPRSLMVMRGPSRWEWQHEIRRVKGCRPPDFKRTSLTLRVKK